MLDFLYRYQKIYRSLDKKSGGEYYHEQRTNYNLQRFNVDYDKYSENWVPRAAQLIFLNRTCYNGLYRVNSKGEFNSLLGDYENPTICDEQNLLAVHKVLQISEIKRADFYSIIHDLKLNAFIYYDPPYRPISKTAGFKNYSKNYFSDSEQIRLSKLFNTLTERGVLQMLSNSDPKNVDHNDDFFDTIYQKHNIVRVPAKRMINSNAKSVV